jgi:hypothetical protein
MAEFSDSPVDRLWQEYSSVFRDWDDLTLARWLAQTLGQIEGRAWRLSHPLIGAFRLAAQIGHDRELSFKRLATAPAAYREAPCCSAPLLPMLARDVLNHGFNCQFCGAMCAIYEHLPEPARGAVKQWAEDYQPIHEVAHWDDAQRKAVSNYNAKFEQAAQKAEMLLGRAGRTIMPMLLETFPAVIWEDQDECLEVSPEDVEL